MGYFILLKTKAAKTWQNAIPYTSKATRSSLESLVKNRLSKRYSAKIITSAQMKTLISKSRSKISSSRAKSKPKKKKSPVKRKK